MFSRMCLYQIVRSFLYPRTEAAMFFTIVPNGQTKPFEFLWRLKVPQVLLHVWKGRGEVRGVQLQHATSPLEASKFYTHWTFKFKKQHVYIWWENKALIFWLPCMVPLIDVYEQTGCPAGKGLSTDWCHTSVISLKVGVVTLSVTRCECLSPGIWSFGWFFAKHWLMCSSLATVTPHFTVSQASETKP